MGPRTKGTKMGRPRKNPEEVKGRVVQFRVTDEQHQRLCEAAEAAGETLSAWLLWLGLRAAEKTKGRK